MGECSDHIPPVGIARFSIPKSTNTKYQEDRTELGEFSVSLTVNDLEVSKTFYEKLGFRVFAGDAAQN